MRVLDVVEVLVVLDFLRLQFSGIASAKSSSRGTQCHGVRDERPLQDLRSLRKIFWQSCGAAALPSLPCFLWFLILLSVQFVLNPMRGEERLTGRRFELDWVRRVAWFASQSKRHAFQQWTIFISTMDHCLDECQSDSRLMSAGLGCD